MIRKLPDRSHVEITARYTHLGQDPVRESTVRIADSIAVGIPREHRPVADRV